MMRARQADELIEWCADAEQIPVLNGFVKGIRRDFAAVKKRSAPSGVMVKQKGK
jgi:hypothetical protein